MSTHSMILAWNIPWTEDPGRLQSMGVAKSQRWLSDWALLLLLCLNVWFLHLSLSSCPAKRFICIIFLGSTSMCYSIFIFVSPTRSISKTVRALSSHPLSLCGNSDLLPHTVHPKWTRVCLCHQELLCIIRMSPKFYPHSTRGRVYFTALQPDTYSCLLEYNCFSMFCYFFLYSEVNQPFVYIYPLPLRPPSPPPPSLPVITELRAQIPVNLGQVPTSYLFYT